MSSCVFWAEAGRLELIAAAEEKGSYSPELREMYLDSHYLE